MKCQVDARGSGFCMLGKMEFSFRPKKRKGPAALPARQGGELSPFRELSPLDMVFVDIDHNKPSKKVASNRPVYHVKDDQGNVIFQGSLLAPEAAAEDAASLAAAETKRGLTKFVFLNGRGEVAFDVRLVEPSTFSMKELLGGEVPAMKMHLSCNDASEEEDGPLFYYEKKKKNGVLTLVVRDKWGSRFLQIQGEEKFRRKRDNAFAVLNVPDLLPLSEIAIDAPETCPCDARRCKRVLENRVHLTANFPMLGNVESKLAVTGAAVLLDALLCT